MRRNRYFPWIIAGLVITALFASTCYIIWWPDLFRKTPIVVGEAMTKDGHRLALVQKWGGDFYYSFLRCEGLDRSTEYYVLGVDDPKAWSCHFSIDDASNTFVLHVGGNSLSRGNWQSKTVSDLNGHNAYGPFLDIEKF